jgi:dihydrofolate reductase
LGNVVVDITVSLDGFIATPEGDVTRLHRWALVAGEGYTDEVRALFDEEEFGAVVAGRGTYDAAGAWGGDPPIHAPYVIVSHDVPTRVATGEWTRFVFVTDGVAAAIAEAKKIAGDRVVGVMGGADIIQQGFNANVVDELRLHVVPVLLGSGIRLFDNLNGQHELELTETRKGPETFRMYYRVLR